MELHQLVQRANTSEPPTPGHQSGLIKTNFQCGVQQWRFQRVVCARRLVLVGILARHFRCKFIIALIDDGTISGKIAKTVFEKMVETGDEAAVIVEREGLVQVTDEGAISEMIDEILAANPDKVEEFRGGKDKLLGFFVGQVMKASGGKANPQAVNKLLRDKLSG